MKPHLEKIKKYLNNSKAEVAFIEHNDFVFICSIIKHMTAMHKDKTSKVINLHPPQHHHSLIYYVK